MAQLKDLIVNGVSRFIGDIFANKAQLTSLDAPTSSGGTTYGPGTSGQVLKTNGTSIYWGADSNSVTGVKGNSESSYRTGNVNLTPANLGAVPTSTTVNGHALSSNVTVSASDVGAVPTSRTVNGYALNSDITLTERDLGYDHEISGSAGWYKFCDIYPSYLNYV